MVVDVVSVLSGEATRAKKTLRRMKFEGRRWVTLELEKNKIVGIR